MELEVAIRIVIHIPAKVSRELVSISDYSC